jgi:hypothetical protein
VIGVAAQVVATVSATVVVAVSVPDVPVIVTVDVPALAALFAENVITLVPVAGLVPNVAVTPAGRPEAAKVTAPLKPAASVTVIVSVALPLTGTESVGDADARLNPDTGPVSVMVNPSLLVHPFASV